MQEVNQAIFSRPLIAVTGDYDSAKARYFINESYFHAVMEAGGIPVLIEPSMSAPEGWKGDLEELMDGMRLPMGFLEAFDGILVTGGDDMVARFFGETQARESSATNPLRDAFEIQVCREAKRLQMPVFGICRGHQVMGVEGGMSLYQDIYQYAGATILHQQNASSWFPSHEVTVRDQTKLQELLGRKTFVNSFHHQAVRVPWGYQGPLKVSAISPDGIVEGLEDPSLPFYLSVQWHPERMLKNPLQLGLFRALVKAAAAYRKAKKS